MEYGSICACDKRKPKQVGDGKLIICGHCGGKIKEVTERRLGITPMNANVRRSTDEKFQ